MPDKAQETGTFGAQQAQERITAGTADTPVPSRTIDARTNGDPPSAPRADVMADTKPQNFDDRLTASFTEAEWQILEGHMAAYFNADTDILATKAHDVFGGQRFVGLWKFAKKYRDGLDKKFPYQADQLVRDRMEDLFSGLKKASRALFRWRTLLLLALLASLFAATQQIYPATKPIPDPGAAGTDGTTAPAQSTTTVLRANAADSTMNLAELYPVALGIISVFYALLWFLALHSARRRNDTLYTAFQTHYQLGTVARLYDRYQGTHDLISTTRLRPPHTPTQEAQRLVRQIERFVALMTWVAKRVEYYEKRFEVEHWRLLSHHFVLNLLYYAILIALFAAYVEALRRYTDTTAMVAFDATHITVFTLAAGLGAALTFLPFFLGFFQAFGAGGRNEFEQGLGVATWIRYSTFNLHNSLAKVVGDQVRRIHQEEDRPR